MAFGGWPAGAIYDTVGFYATAFAAGIVFNVAHLMVISALVWRRRSVSWNRKHLPNRASARAAKTRARLVPPPGSGFGAF
jgi:hypothetical protein